MKTQNYYLILLLIAFTGSFSSCSAQFKVSEIGPGGGYIFFDKGETTDGWRYLEAAPAGWYSGPGTNDPEVWWGCPSTQIDGTSDVVGMGQKNTATILNACNEKNTAAYLCQNAVIKGFNDWFLPSKNELHLMYSNLAKLGLGGFGDGAMYYWSSTEHSGYVYTQKLCTEAKSRRAGKQALKPKNYTPTTGINISTRPIRSF